MKGLMPLALSPSPTKAQPPTQQRPQHQSPPSYKMEDGEHGYFPEVLARDLELSTDVFASRRMTAGIPSSSLATDYRPKMRAANGSMPNNTVRAFSPYRTASVRVQLLGAIEEREAMAQQDIHMDTASDLDSIPGSDESGGLPPPNFRYRNQSIVTTATSLASSNLIPSPKATPPPPEEQEPCSWIAGDSDDEGMDAEPEHDFPMDPLSPLSPRPPTQDSKITMINTRAEQPVQSQEPWPRSHFIHKKSHSVSGGSPIGSPRPQLSEQFLNNIDKRPSQQFNDEAIFGKRPQRQLSTSAFTSDNHVEKYYGQQKQPRQPTKAGSFNHEDAPGRLSINTNVLAEDVEDDDFDSLYEPDIPQSRPRNQPSRESVYIRPSPPPSPLPSVQSWLNNSLQPYPASLVANDDGAKVVPLPPNVMETLRVNVACFPETMLLSSSLTIDTIRSYARKVRHPGVKGLEPSPPPSPTYPGRRSLWRKVVSHKRSVDFKSNNGFQTSTLTVQSSVPGAVDAPKPWMAMKNVFGSCSDYICDALYAHVLAYNYISALVAKLPPPPQPNRQRSFSSKAESQDNVPKKAASLLGLGGGANIVSSRAGRLTKKISTQNMPWGRDEMVTNQSAQLQSQDSALRGVQSGLLKCISRLIATAKLMAENGESEAGMLDMDKEDKDMLLTRSLCEIVRLAEECN